MGQGGMITLVNSTGYDWTKTYEHSFQMCTWSFPATLRAGQAANVYVEWEEGLSIDSKDDAGEATYTFGTPGSTLEFQIQARADKGFDLRVAFLNFATPNNPEGSVLSLGWDHDGYVSFILVGDVENLVSSNPPTAWMQWMLNHFPQLKQSNLRHLCMPGSHDAGMSVFGAGTLFANKCNTETQTQSILGQLIQGARYLDIRPVISCGNYYTGHYSYIDAICSWQGSNGQSIDTVVSDINEFTRENAELVILNLSHDLNTDLGNCFTQVEWDNLLEALKRLDFLYLDPKPTSVDLSLHHLDHYIGQGKACVLVIVDPSDSSISLGELAGQGFYTTNNLMLFNEYSDTNSLEKMASDQFEKMRAQRKRPSAPCFLLSWTLTQSDLQAITCGFTCCSSILELAAIANPALPAYLWPATLSCCYPNILYTDKVTTSVSAALSLAINWMTAQGD